MNDIVWKWWWRNVEGAVSHDEGFSFSRDPDYFYFDIDPETQDEQISEDDPRYCHVDELFDTEEAAYEAAVEWCQKEQVILHNKMKELGIK